MRPLILVGLIVTALATASGFALLFLIAVIVVASSSSGNYSAEFGSHASDYHEYPKYYNDSYSDPYANVFQDSPPLDHSPADPWLNGAEIDSGIYGGGTIDRSGEGNHVFRVGTEVLNLPN